MSAGQFTHYEAPPVRCRYVNTTNGFVYRVGDRVRHTLRAGWRGTVVESRLAGQLTVAWDDGPQMYDASLGDRIGSSVYDLLESELIHLELVR